MVWRGVVWRGVVWCGVVWCGVVWCGAVKCILLYCVEVLHSVDFFTTTRTSLIARGEQQQAFKYIETLKKEFKVADKRWMRCAFFHPYPFLHFLFILFLIFHFYSSFLSLYLPPSLFSSLFFSFPLEGSGG